MVRKDDLLLEGHVKEEMERYAHIETRLDAIEKQMASIIEMWTQARGVLTFIKVVAGLVAVLAAAYTFITSNFTLIVK